MIAMPEYESNTFAQGNVIVNGSVVECDDLLQNCTRLLHTDEGITMIPGIIKFINAEQLFVVSKIYIVTITHIV